MKRLIRLFSKHIAFSKFTFANDEWLSLGERDFLINRYVHDKVYHFIRDFLFLSFFYLIFSSLPIALAFALTFNLLWEIKDAFMHVSVAPPTASPFFKYLYGDGFSWKDFVAGSLGSLTCFFFALFFVKFVSSNAFLFFLTTFVIALLLRWIYIKCFIFFAKNRFF